MPKRSITIYVDSTLFEQIKKSKQLREKLVPPGWPKTSSYAAHLIEEGLKVEETFLDEVLKNNGQKKSSGVVGTTSDKKKT